MCSTSMGGSRPNIFARSHRLIRLTPTAGPYSCCLSKTLSRVTSAAESPHDFLITVAGVVTPRSARSFGDLRDGLTIPRAGAPSAASAASRRHVAKLGGPNARAVPRRRRSGPGHLASVASAAASTALREWHAPSGWIRPRQQGWRHRDARHPAQVCRCSGTCTVMRARTRRDSAQVRDVPAARAPRTRLRHAAACHTLALLSRLRLAAAARRHAEVCCAQTRPLTRVR